MPGHDNTASSCDRELEVGQPVVAVGIGQQRTPLDRTDCRDFDTGQLLDQPFSRLRLEGNAITCLPFLGDAIRSAVHCDLGSGCSGGQGNQRQCTAVERTGWVRCAGGV